MATDTVVALRGVNVLHCAPDGPALDGERAALDLIGDAMGRDAHLVAVPAERVGEEFFRLGSGVAGAIMQKFVNYRMRLAVLGDISRHVTESTALRDFVHETNRQGHVWFLADVDALDEKLGAVG